MVYVFLVVADAYLDFWTIGCSQEEIMQVLNTRLRESQASLREVEIGFPLMWQEYLDMVTQWKDWATPGEHTIGQTGGWNVVLLIHQLLRSDQSVQF